MIKFIHKLLGLCDHKWITVKTTSVFAPNRSYGKERPVGFDYLQQCEHCGKLKVFKTY